MREQREVRGAWSSWARGLVVGALSLAATGAWGFTQGGGLVPIPGAPVGLVPIGHEWLTSRAALEVLGDAQVSPSDPRLGLTPAGTPWPHAADISIPPLAAQRIKSEPIYPATDWYSSLYRKVDAAVVGQRWVDSGGFNVVAENTLYSVNCWDAVAQYANDVQHDHFNRERDESGGAGAVAALSDSVARFRAYFVSAAMAPDGIVKTWDGGVQPTPIEADRHYFLFGRALHLLQDSFSSDHSVREPQDGFLQVKGMKTSLCTHGSEVHSSVRPFSVDPNINYAATGDIIWSTQNPNWTPGNVKLNALTAVEASKDAWAAFIRVMETPRESREALARSEAARLASTWMGFDATLVRARYDDPSTPGLVVDQAACDAGKGGSDFMERYRLNRNKCLYNIGAIDGTTERDTHLHLPLRWDYKWLFLYDSPAGFDGLRENPNAAFVSMASPASLVAGQPFTAQVTLKNTGDVAWTSVNHFRLGAQSPQDNSTWGTNRILLGLGESVQPGEQKTFTLQLAAPGQSGAYGFQWQMLQENVQWFGEATSSRSIAVQGSGAQPVSFAPASLWSPHYGDNEGWSSDPAYWQTLGFPDLNGDGRADVCGRGVYGMACALSTGSGFGASSMWTDGFQDAYGWKASESYWGTVQFADVNGDGKADVCGRGEAGVHCALSTGSGFVSTSNGLWTTGFANAYGWGASKAYWGTLQFADVNGDGKADVCARGPRGISCELSTGSGFVTSSTPWTSSFSDAGGWNTDESYWGTIQFADVNGDGKADVCGRSSSGVTCEVSTGSSFNPSSGVWALDYSDANGWHTDPSYWKTIRFPDLNGDGKADVCGRGKYGVYCALSTANGFGPGGWWTWGFQDAYGWNSNAAYWQTVSFSDVNGDGLADVCGRGVAGVYCLTSTGTAFQDSSSPASTGYTDALGWNTAASYWQTLQLQDLNGDGKADLCGRASDGLRCALNQ